MNKPIRLAVVDDEKILRTRLARFFRQRGLEVETFAQGGEFLAALAGAGFDVVLLDVRLPDLSGLEVFRRAREVAPAAEVILITGYAALADAVEAVKAGAFYYLSKPFSLEQVEALVTRAAEKASLSAENRALRAGREAGDPFAGLVGISAKMRIVFEAAAKVAGVDCNVLIQGESGTGKELLARAVHGLSGRARGPFVSFNCGGFCEELVANELFGHEKEAFTGAETTRIGLLEAAQGGTLFLDEIGEMPPSMQVKLLRVIQERKLLRLGGTKPVDLDLRIISATNKDLEREVPQGRFRQDLFYRLKVVELRLPPLRERKEDIPLLINHFLEKYNQAYRKNVQGFDREALGLMMRYSFPGNVRELENIVSGAVALADGAMIKAADLPADLARLEVRTLDQDGFVSLEEQEKSYIARVLAATRGNRSQAARILSLPRTTLWRKIKQYRLDLPEN